MSKASSCKSHLGRQFHSLLSLVLQVALDPVRQRKMGKKVESVASNTVSDALTTQLAKQPWCSYEKETGKHYLSLLIGG